MYRFRTTSEKSESRRIPVRLLAAALVSATLAILVGISAASPAAAAGIGATQGAKAPGPASATEQMETLRDSLAVLERNGAKTARSADEESSRAVPGGTAWFLHGVLRGLGQGVGQGSFLAILSELGEDKSERMLSEMSSTLNELMFQVEAMATRMEQLASDTQFKSTHRDARTAYDVVEGWARTTDPGPIQSPVPDSDPGNPRP